MDADHLPDRPIKTYSACSGFTLIEMMVTIAVLAILASLAAPAFTTMIANNRVSAAASDVQSLFLYSRAEAVYLRTRLQVSALPSSQTWQARRVGGTDVLREIMLSPVVAADINPAGTVTFETSGAVTNPVKVTLTAPNASRQFCVEVTRAGLVRSNRQNVGDTC